MRLLPRVFFTADGQPLELADWSFGSQANLGYNQLRGVAVGTRARSFAHRIDQGSFLKAYTETGVQVFEGDVPAPPKLTQDGRVFIAAQGHGIQASKSGDRISPVLTAPGAWIPSSQPPANYPTPSSFDVQVTTTVTSRSFAASIGNGGSFGSDWTVAFVAPGMRLSRFKANLDGVSANDIWRVLTAEYPDVERTAALQAVSATTTTHDFDVTFDSPADVVLLQVYDTLGGGVIAKTVRDPKIWGDYDFDVIYTHDAARIVARQLGWDDIGVTGRGAAPITSLDWAGDAAGFLSYAAGLDDFCWGVWQDTGSTPNDVSPLMTFGPYGRRIWNVSGRTGARWDMDPLERVRQVLVQFLNVDNTLGEFSLEAPDSAQLPEGVVSVLRGSLTDAQSDTTLALTSAWSLLRRFIAQRYRGRIQFARAFDSDTGQEATYEVRAGDEIRITDFAMDGAITLPIHDVEFTAEGCVVGVEAPAFPLSGGPPTSQAGRGAVPLTSTTGGTATYVPPGAPGAATQQPSYGPGGATGLPFPYIFPGRPRS